jgi:drug/metabolite transporter (DMT)-like permease
MIRRNLLYFAMLATAAVWGGSFVLMKDAIQEQDVYSFLSSRFLVASALMIAYRPNVFKGLSPKFIRAGRISWCLTWWWLHFSNFRISKNYRF